MTLQLEDLTVKKRQLLRHALHAAGMLGAAANVFPAYATEDSIRAAIAECKASGRGGKILISPYIDALQIRDGLIPLTKPLISDKDLFAHGLEIEFADTPSWVELSAEYAKGRGFVGDGVAGLTPGTFNAFEWNADDATGTDGRNGTSVKYASAKAMHDASLRGFTLKNCILRSFKYGYKFGAFNTVGVHSLCLDKIICEDCDISGWIENCMQPSIGYIASSCPKTGGFGIYGSMGTGEAGGLLWHFGNGIIEHIYHQGGGRMSTPYTWGIDVGARGTSSEFNNMTILNMQANGMSSAQTLYTQANAPVITAGSANIAITSNIDRFRVDSLVSFGTTAGGIFNSVLYWIIGVTNNGDGTGSIRVGTRRRAVGPVIPSANASSTIKVYPCALIMIGGWGEGGGVNNLTFSRFPLIDIEAATGVGLAVGLTRGCYYETSIVTGWDSSASVAVFSGGEQRNTLACRHPLNLLYLEADNWRFDGYQPLSYFGGGSTPRRHQGLLTDQPNGSNYGVSRLFMSSDRRDLENMRARDGDHYIGSPATFGTCAEGRPRQAFHGRLASGATITPRSGGLITYTGAAGGSLTLPMIAPVATSTNDQGQVTTTVDMQGLCLEIMNPTAGNLTLNSQNGQGFNGGASTSFVVPANTLVQLRVCSVDGAAFFWAAR